MRRHIKDQTVCVTDRNLAQQAAEGLQLSSDQAHSAASPKPTSLALSAREEALPTGETAAGPRIDEFGSRRTKRTSC